MAGLSLARARDIHTKDPCALIHDYKSDALPRGTTLRIAHWMRHVNYTLFFRDRVLFRAMFSLDLDELINVRTAPYARNHGIARAAIGLILRIDGPTHIQALPSDDCPISLGKLLQFYSSFPGYHVVPGTNRVFRLMQNDNGGVEEAGEYGLEEAAIEYKRRQKSQLEMAVLEQNSREYKRIMAILQPINDKEVEELLRVQATDRLSITSAMQVYDEAFFAGTTWGRAERVKFAQGMANLLLKHAAMRYGVWDKIIADDAI